MIIPHDKLKEQLDKVAVIIEKEMEHKVLFSAKQGQVTLTVVKDNHIGKFSFDIKDKSTLEFVAPYALLATISILDKDSEFTLQNNILTVRNHNTIFYQTVSGAAGYYIPDITKSNLATIKVLGCSLKKLFKKVMDIPLKKDSRPFICGINLVFDGKMLQVEATDAMRFVRNHISIDGYSDVAFAGIVNLRSAAIIQKIRDLNLVRVSMNEKFINLRTVNMDVYLPLINSPYPSDIPVVAATDSPAFTFSPQDILKAFKDLVLLGDEMLYCKMFPRELAVMVKNSSGECLRRVQVYSQHGSNFEFCIQGRHIKDIFKHFMNCDRITFRQATRDKIIYFNDEKNLTGLLSTDNIPFPTHVQKIMNQKMSLALLLNNM